MNSTMEYKGYVGSVEFSEEDSVFFGKVMGIRALVSYEGKTVRDVVKDFHASVDDYLALCAAEGIEPDDVATHEDLEAIKAARREWAVGETIPNSAINWE